MTLHKTTELGKVAGSLPDMKMPTRVDETVVLSSATVLAALCQEKIKEGKEAAILVVRASC